MNTMQIDHGLIVNPTTEPPTCYGYIMNFSDKGAFAPTGKIDVTPEQIETHNRLLADAGWTALLEHGKGTLYLTPDKTRPGTYTVTDWPGVHRIPVTFWRTSFHNMAGRNGRTDVWFWIGNEQWHGVNIGDNELVRVKRNKQR